MHIADFLAEHHVAFEAIPHPPAFSAQKRAKYLHVPGRQVAKGVLLAGPHGYFLAVLAAPHHVDPIALGESLGGPVRLADDREIAQVFLDCEWGVVLPFGSRYGLPTVLDDSIDPETSLWFEANYHGQAIRMTCREFERLENPRRLRFAR